MGIFSFVFLRNDSKAFADWYNDNWTYRVPLKLTGIADTNKKVKFDIDTRSSAGQTLENKIQADCGDSRFTDVNGAPLKYYIDAGGGACNTSSTDYYVLVPTFYSTGTTIYHYYGNATAPNGTQGANFSEATYTSTTTANSEEIGPGPTAWWKFDEGNGTTTEDSTSTNADGTLTNGPVWKNETECMNGKCLYFDGSDDYVIATDPTALDFTTNDFSVSGWFKTDSSARNKYLMTKRPTCGHDNFWSIQVTAAGVLGGEVDQDGVGTNYNAWSGTKQVSDNKWHHFTVVRVGATITQYVDGVLDVSSTGAGTANLSNSANLYIGALGCATTTNPWIGQFDSLKVYPYARSAAEIKTDAVQGAASQGSSSVMGVGADETGRNLTNGLVGWWKLDETASPSLDSSGIGATGTWSGNTASTIGQFSNAAIFDGTNDSINISDNDRYSASTTRSLTVAAWIKPDIVNTRQDFVSKAASSNYEWALRVDSDGSIRGDIFQPDGSADYLTATTSAGSATAGTWYHVVLTLDLSISSAKLYVNGKFVSEDDSPTGTTYANGNAALRIGEPADSSRDPDGAVDEVRIYNRALTLSEVEGLYSYSPPPVGHWKFDENNGYTSIVDSSGNENTLTVNSTGGAPVTRVSDLFTVGSNTLITARTPNVGTSWTEVRDTTTSGANALIDSGNDTVAAQMAQDNVGQQYTAQPAPTLKNQTISYTLKELKADSSDCTIGLFGRYTDANNFYAVQILPNNNADDSLALWKMVAGTAELLTSVDVTYAVNDVISLDITNQTKRVYVNNVLQLSSTDNAVTAVGNWGVSFGDLVNNTNICVSWEIDNFLAQETSALYWRPGKYGSSVELNNAYLSRNDDSDFDFAAADQFSISGWFKRGPISTTTEYLLTKAQAGTNAGYKLYMESDGDITFAIDDDSTWAPADSATSTAATYDDNQWHHFTASKNGTTGIYLHIDGQLVASDTSIAETGTLANDDPLHMGMDDDGLSNNFSGSLDDIKIYRYVRSSGQMTEDFNAGHPIGGSPMGSQAAYWRLDEGYGITTRNAIANGQNGTLTNMASPATATSGWTNSSKFGKALTFDGTNDHVSLGDVTSMDSLSTLSVSAWVKTTTLTGGDASLRYVVAGESGSPSTTSFILRLNTSTDKFEYYIGGSDFEGVLSNTTVAADTWYHVAGVYDGATLKFYINGVLDATTTASGATGNPTNYYIGSYTNALRFWEGKIDEVKLYSTALTPDQVKVDFNRGKSTVFGSTSTASDGKTPSNSADREYCIPGDTSTCSAPVGEWKFEEGTGTTANDTSANANNGTLTSGPSWAPGKIGNAMLLDGNDDYVLVTDPASGVLDFGASQDFTISAWIKGRDTSGAPIIYKSTTSAIGYRLFNHDTTNDLHFRIEDATTEYDCDTNTNVYDDEWHHVSAQRVGSTIYAYIDGVQKCSLAATSNSLANSVNFFIGKAGSGTEITKGHIDEVRVYNYARTQAQILWEYNKGAPMAWYKFDECEGATAYNYALTANRRAMGSNGTISIGGTGSNTAIGSCVGASSTAWKNGASGKYSASLDFDGTDDYVDLASLPTSFSADVTLSAWIKSTTTHSYQARMVDLAQSTATVGIQLSMGINGTIGIDNTGGPSNTVFTTTAKNDGQWHHIVAVRSGTTYYVYVDNVLVGTTAGTATTLTAMEIGKQTGGTQYFDGQVDDVRIYNYALTPYQVRDVFNNGAVSFK